MFLNRRSLVLALLVCVPVISLQGSAFSTIAQAHLASLPPLLEQASDKKSTKKNTQLWKDQHLQERELFGLLYQAFDHSNLQKSPVLNTDGSTDLELVRGNAQATASVLNELPLITTCGSIYAAYVINNPTDCINELEQRQAIIKAFIENNKFRTDIQQLLNTIKAGEKHVGLLLANSEANEQLTKLVLFSRPLKVLNTSRVAQNLTAGTNYTLTGVGHALPVLGLVSLKYALQKKILPFFIKAIEKSVTTPEVIKAMEEDPKFKEAIQEGLKAWQGKLSHIENIPLTTYLKEVSSGNLMRGFLTLEQIFCSYMAHNLKTSKLDPVVHLQKLLISVADSVRCLDLIANNKDAIPALKGMKNIHLIEKYTSKSSEYAHSPMVRLVNLLRTNTFKGSASHFSFQGNTRAAFALLLESRNEIHELFSIVGEIDTHLACATLLQQSETQSIGYTFAEYVGNAATPSISATDIWHPLVGQKKSVTNSIELGGDHAANIILTGPNAGGKSTFLKGLTLNILFAQTLGIAPAKRFALTPFAKINTYMNIADDTAGGNSLFKSEVLRAQKLLDTVTNLSAGQFSFSVMDEMFSGTSPKEGEAAGYAVAEKLGSLHNSMLLLATHFQKLTALETETNNFTNYQVRVVRHDNGTFSYPFKLEVGKANQNVAIDILKQQGFASSILDSANAILEQQN